MILAEIEREVEQETSQRNADVVKIVLQRLKQTKSKIWTAAELRLQPLGTKFKHSTLGIGYIASGCMKWENTALANAVFICDGYPWNEPMELLSRVVIDPATFEPVDKISGLCDHASIFKVYSDTQHDIYTLTGRKNRSERHRLRQENRRRLAQCEKFTPCGICAGCVDGFIPKKKRKKPRSPKEDGVDRFINEGGKCWPGDL